MWAIRRPSTNSFNFRASGLNVAAFRACAGLGPVNSHSEEKSSASELHLFTSKRWITSKPCKCTLPVPKPFSAGYRCFSSQTGARSGGEEDDDLEDGFSELETPEASEKVEAHLSADDNSSDSESDSDLSSLDSNVDDTLETVILGDTEEDAVKTASKKKTPSALCKLIFEERGSSISAVLDRYAEANGLCRSEVYQVLLNLRRRKLFVKALQLSEWLERKGDFVFSERDYASRVDLIAKVCGLEKAEAYIDQIPISFRQDVVYAALLANSVKARLVQKSEQLFNKMKDLGFPITVFTCNSMLVLYKRSDKRKIGDVLVMMEKENIKPSNFTYLVLIDAKGQSNDIHGMEQVIETMKTEGVELNIRIKAILASHYASAGLEEKAKEILKEMEGNDLKSNRFLCPILLPIYAKLGNAKEVERIWKYCESEPRQLEIFAAIDAFGKLKNVKQAEAIFEERIKTYKKVSTRQYSIMLQVYAENKMLSKGKELVMRMGNAGCIIGPMAWDALVKLYVNAGEVEKADSVLQKAVERSPRMKPTFSSYIAILNQYSRRGDVHNAEKIFERMRKAGYVPRARQYQFLIQTYINAKVPAYGIRERMKADDIYPSKSLATQLALVDASAIGKTDVSELLD